jgi:schlafen family protein
MCGHESLKILEYHRDSASRSFGRYYIVDRSGVVIDVQGFIADLAFRADLTKLHAGARTETEPITNETWRLLVTPVAGGLAVLGVLAPEDVTRVDERLQDNAKRFGKSLEEAAGISPSDIDRNLDYALLDDDGRIRFVLGGIPLKLLGYPKVPLGETTEIRAHNGGTYGCLSVPFADASGQSVGTVTVLEELSPPPWFSLRAWLTNLAPSLVLAMVGTVIGTRFIPEKFSPDDRLREALERGESPTVEFKEALRWDSWPSAPPAISAAKAMAEAIAVKTVAGFLNSRLGGTLFVGIADDKRIVGLDRDYESLVRPGQVRGSQDKDRDRFQVHLHNVLGAKIGRDICNLCVETAIIAPDGKDVCVVGVSPSPTPVYLADRKGKVFYLREGASTVELDVEQAVKYSGERWPGPLVVRVRRLIGAG